MNLQVPRTQTTGRGADAIAEAAWASSLSTSAPSQQHAASPLSDQQMASHASSQHLALSGADPQAACAVQRDRDGMAGSQARQCGPSRFSLGASDDVQGGPESQALHVAKHSLSRLIPMAADSGSAQHIPSHGRPMTLQSFPEVAPCSEGQTACLDGGSRNERSADRSSCAHSAAARAQPAHAPAPCTAQHEKHLDSQHHASAAPVNAAQHCRSRPQVWERRGHIHQGLIHLSAGHEQGLPGHLSTSAGLEASQMSHHSQGARVAQRPGPSAASLRTSKSSSMAAVPPGAVVGPQPKPMGNLGRPSQMPACPSSMQPRTERRLPASATAPRGQQVGSSGPAPALVPGSMGSGPSPATAAGVSLQGWPDQQTMPMHTGASMPEHACGRPVAMPPQHGPVPMSSMRTPQRPPQLHAQQKHYSGRPEAHAAQPQTAQQSSSAAGAGKLHQPIPQSSGRAATPASYAGRADQMVSSRASSPAVAAAAARPEQDAGKPGLLLLPDASGLEPHLASMGNLPLSVMQSWVRADVQAAMAHLELTSEVRQPVLSQSSAQHTPDVAQTNIAHNLSKAAFLTTRHSV